MMHVGSARGEEGSTESEGRWREGFLGVGVRGVWSTSEASLIERAWGGTVVDWLAEGLFGEEARPRWS
jgi:hypothetical protein